MIHFASPQRTARLLKIMISHVSYNHRSINMCREVNSCLLYLTTLSAVQDQVWFELGELAAVFLLASLLGGLLQ